MKKRLMLRKMGYLRDQRGIINRYLREGKNWEPHLHNTREFIMQSAKDKDKNMAVILGSGWLLDIPIEELASEFTHVVLYDIIQPAQVRKKTESFSNVKLKEADLTGGLVDFLYNYVKDKKHERLLVESLSDYAFHYPERPDFVVSCNVLTQLGTLLTEFIKKKKTFTEKEINRLEQIIQKNHLEMLPKGKSCLITDYEEELYSAEAEFAGTRPLLKVRLPENESKRNWQWKFDTYMKYRKRFATYLNVTALNI
jgi:hypothetical protein